MNHAPQVGDIYEYTKDPRIDEYYSIDVTGEKINIEIEKIDYRLEACYIAGLSGGYGWIWIGSLGKYLGRKAPRYKRLFGIYYIPDNNG